MDYCNLCPRNCRVNRELGNKGVCGETDEIRVALASLHMWEEPPISGETGSGTVFFSGCPLHCVYCQNYSISSGEIGRAVTTDELCSIFLHLQEKGAKNINLVTATQFVPKIRGALIKAKQEGLTVPVVYNTSSYESVNTIKYLNGLVDIYLPDLKYKSSELAKKYSNAPDYFDVATKAIAEMYHQVGPDMIVRHLVLPGCTEDSKDVIRYLWDTYGDNITISIMSQYTPMPSCKVPELGRKLSKEEYDEVVDFAADLGITKAFVQEGEAAQESFIPDFQNWDLEEFLKS
ncbi:MAG: radical SAM protein [Clostridia bacterium]|nr:radical SAM protein [Clostridia bacterium]